MERMVCQDIWREEMRDINPDSEENQKQTRENEIYKLSLQYISCVRCGRPIHISHDALICHDCEHKSIQDSI